MPLHRLMTRGCFAAALHLGGTVPASGQPATISCSRYLEGIKRKVEENYGGFRLEVVGKRRSAYEDLVAGLRVRAERTAVDRCFPVLHDFTSWFEDPHLFVFQSTRVDSATARARRAAVVRREVAEPDLRDDFRRRADRPDPIEGIWTDGRLRVAILPAGENRFEAVVLTPDTSTWSAGDVRATIVPEASGYTVDLLGRNHSLRTLDAMVRKRVLLRLSPEMWALEHPVRPEDAGLVDLADPRRPTLLVREGTMIVSIPSHSPAYRPVLDSLIARYADALRASQRLIVDLRGNEGGSSFTSNGLLPYVLSADELPAHHPPRGGAVMLSSPDQIAYARRSFGPDTSRFVRTLLDRLIASPGRFVPLEEPGRESGPWVPDSLIYGPDRVGVLIDGGTVSASEVFVLRAQRSTRVTVFGLPTAGALDYPSVNIVPIVSGPARWYLGYPAIARDTLLPRDGMRGRGIAPQVRVDWDTVPDPIALVDRRLREPR